MKEASNRFKGWYRKKNPRVGQISVPFVFNTFKDTFRIALNHLVHDLFNAEAFSQLTEIPEATNDLYFSEKNIRFEGELNDKVIQFKTSNPIKAEGIKYWFSDLNLDKEKNLLSGYLNLGVSVDELYNAKISFED